MYISKLIYNYSIFLLFFILIFLLFSTNNKNLIIHYLFMHLSHMCICIYVFVFIRLYVHIHNILIFKKQTKRNKKCIYSFYY